jgi:adenine-specific DNA-methyltransferase
MDKMTEQDGASLNVVGENIQALKIIFPEAFTEDKLDFDVLRQLLGDAVDESEEKYGLNWHGKKKARQIALTPSTGTLRPCPEESVDWDTTQNLFIEGDNLEVLKLLQKSYANKVKMIYIDPPYNTGKEFIYPDKYQDNLDTYLRYTGQKGEEGFKTSSNTESSGRYHTNWLNMMYPRLKLARNLLKSDGVIFISIDDNEMNNLRKITDEIFGIENFVATIIWQKVFSPKNTAKYFSEDHDYILVYSKQKEIWEPQLLPRSEEAKDRYTNPDNDPRGPWSSSDLTARNYYGDGQYEVTGPTGKIFGPGKGRYWRQNFNSFKELDKDNRIWWGKDGGNMPRLKRFLSEVKDGVVPQTLLLHTVVGNTQEAKKELLEFSEFEETENVLNSVKPTRLLRHLLKIGTSPKNENIVLDFFAGSGPMAHAVMLQNFDDGGNRKFILVQLPEKLPKEEASAKTIADLAKSRIRNVIKKIYGKNPGKSGLGFKLFKLDSSNIRAWNPDRNDLEGTLYEHTEHLAPNRSEEDVLYELLLKRGVDLTVPIESKEMTGKTVYSIGYGVLFACLDSTISRDEIEYLAQGIVAWHKDLAPASDTQVVFRDSAFIDDVAKTNMTAILEQNGIKHVRSL